MGDVEYNGTLTSSDALTVLQYSTNRQTPSNLQFYLGDYNYDGEITASDAQLILSAATSS